jgi:ribosomal protein S12 methylthiotransferase
MTRRTHTAYLVSLGCPKNRVDTEVMLGAALAAGWRPVTDPAEASAIVVNTCGFIQAAKEESIQTILQLSQYKRIGRCKKLIVAGCLSQRYAAELAEQLPEVDHFLGVCDLLALPQVLRRRAARVLVSQPGSWLMTHRDPRTLSTPCGSAYLRLAEGCNRRCSFCVIPAIRGPQRSRAPDDILAEARHLSSLGVRELNLISQDSIAYGRDLRAAPSLAQLVRSIAETQSIHWVRILYLYPEPLPAELLALWAEHPRVVPYVDLPLQHVSAHVLRQMRRGHGARRARELVQRLRRSVPGVVLRTSFLVGHPGERRADFDELCDFVRWAEFDHVGVFCYSDEEGSVAHKLTGKVAARVAEARARKLIRLQRGISRRRNRARVGSQLEVLVIGPSEEHELVMTGRHAGQAPEVDGIVYLSGAEVQPGQLRRVVVVEATDYDLLGEVIDGDEARPHQQTPTVAGEVVGGAPLVHRSSDGRRVLRTLAER